MIDDDDDDNNNNKQYNSWSIKVLINTNIWLNFDLTSEISEEFAFTDVILDVNELVSLSLSCIWAAAVLGV